ncbi:MAG: helix-turn-helix domain-containing protein [Muribaculaceae bacterium]|nr:helix-turn-helix domain-containing protein [Muribaculaceae bacterium]
MADEIITKSDSRIISARGRTKQAFDAVSVIRESHHPILNGISFLNDEEVAKHFNVTRRTIQNYRDAGLIPYYKICGKCLYAEHEIKQLMDDNYHPRYNE